MADQLALPQGFTLDTPPAQPLPQGFTLDAAPTAANEEESGIADQILRQVGLTGRAAAQGAAGIVGLAADPFADATRRVINLALEDKIPQSSFRGLIKGFLDDAGVPEPETTLEKIVSSVNEAVVGGGGTIGLGRKLVTEGAEFVTKEVGSALAAAPTTQLAATATGELAAQGVREAGGGPLLQFGANLAAGGVTTGIGSKIGGTPTAPSQAADDIALGKEFDVPVLTSDVRPAETFAAKTGQTIGERVPVVGTGPVRVAQQEKRVEAIKDVLIEFGADDVAKLSDDVMGDLVKTRGDAIQKFSGAKTEIIDRLDDPASAVPVERTLKTIDEEITQLKGLKTEELAPAIKILEDWRNAVQGQGIKNLEALRRQIGETFASPDLVSVKGSTQKALNNIYGSVRADMGEFILNTGGPADHKKWQVANQKLSEMMGELSKTALKSALNKGTVTPEAVKGLLFSKKPSDIKSLHKNLSPKGRATARAAILSEIASKSMTGGIISPAKFITQLGKHKAQFDVFFQGDKGIQIDGLKRILQVTERASVSGVAPPTGVQNTIPILGVILTDLVGSMGAAFASATGVGGAARLYESKAVRDALTHLSRTKVTSKGEAVAVKRIIAAAQSFKANQEESQ